MTTAQRIELLRLGWEAYAAAAYSEQRHPDAAARTAMANLTEWCDDAVLCADVAAETDPEDLVNWALAEAKARSLRIRLGIQDGGDAPWYTGYAAAVSLW